MASIKRDVLLDRVHSRKMSLWNQQADKNWYKVEAISNLSRKPIYLSNNVYVPNKAGVLLKFQQRACDAFIKRKASV